jgi:hypothetical protein
MGRGKSNPETVAAQRKVEKAERVERNKAAGNDAVGKGAKPGFGTGEWARAHGVWKDRDTEGPAKKP